MCGICGYITKNEFSSEVINRMNNTMIHRGPDDLGTSLWSNSGWNYALGHRRLSIIDLSQLGHQPMYSCDGSIGIVYNGEIYNYLEIKKVLEDKGYKLRTKCDTEIIIYAYVEWGNDMVSHLNGMFSIAILDKNNNSLSLFRDRIGKKPLYYSTNGNDFIFASELKPLMYYPKFNKVINEEILTRFMYHQYINGPESVFKGVYKLQPGHALMWKDGTLKEWCYWDLLQKRSEHNTVKTSYFEAKAEGTDLLRDSVRIRMMSDVPLGVFLSGGIDSTLVLAFAQQLSEQPINTFSIGFNESDFDEATYAKEISRYLGTKHHEMYVDEESMLQLIDGIPEYYDEPFADSSQIPMMAVSQLAKRDVTVALSGDGGDEVFCGYNMYDGLSKLQKIYKYRYLTKFTGTLFGLFGKEFLDGKLFRYSNYLKEINSLESAIQPGFFSIEKGLIKSLTINEQLPLSYSVNYSNSNLQEARMLLDMLTYLPADILTKVDRASMRYSLETRCPILDYRLIEYSFSLPHAFKYKDGEKKVILKDILYDMVPKRLLDRPKKGFSVPIDSWLKGSLKTRVTDYLSEEYIKKQGLFDSDEVGKFINKYYHSSQLDGYQNLYSRVLWSLLMFQMWYHKWIRP